MSTSASNSINIDGGQPPSPTVEDCPKYKTHMICINSGGYSCYMHNGSGWGGRSFIIELSSGNPGSFVPATQKIYHYVLSYGQCPGRDQRGYVGVAFRCTEENRNNLLLNDKCEE